MGDDEAVEVLVVPGRHVVAVAEDAVPLVAHRQGVLGRLLVGLQPLEPLDVGGGQRLDPAVESGRLAPVYRRVGRAGLGDDGVAGARGLVHLQGVVLRLLSDQVARPAGVDAAVCRPHDGELESGLAALIVDGLVDVLTVLEPKDLRLGGAQGLAGHLEGLSHALGVLALGLLGLVGEDGRRHFLVLVDARRQPPRVNDDYFDPDLLRTETVDS